MGKTILLVSIFVLLAFAGNIFAQEKPIGQTEYVRMLYSLERDPGLMSEVVEGLRRRGIDFRVTDGLRSLTRTKSRNDPELRRALEEAERRRANPETAEVPSAEEAAAIIEKTRSNTLEAVAEMPDFVVKQQIQRSDAYAGTGNYRSRDRLVVAVSYRSTGEEEYKLLSVNGVLQENPARKSSYAEAGGTSSTGEFVTMLSTIFKRENNARFDVVYTDTIRGRRAVMFDFEIARDKAQQQITSTGAITTSTMTGMKGRLWVDRDLHRVLRIESEATEIPSDFPISSASRNIDYDWTTISDERYLLPSLSEVRLTFRQSKDIYETRNLIRFRDYQKYGTEVQILEVDDEPIEEENP